MGLTLWTGISWLIMASTVGGYLVEAARALGPGLR